MVVAVTVGGCRPLPRTAGSLCSCKAYDSYMSFKESGMAIMVAHACWQRVIEEHPVEYVSGT
jgi:hypothetical protein